jgi:acetyltransferase-like isoleucine patch superfamily enzyme
MPFKKHPTALIGKGARIGDGTRVWAFVNIQPGARVGKNCNICDCCYIEAGALVGDNVTVKNGVSVYDGVILEENVFVGPNVAFINDRYPRSRQQGWRLEKTLVRKGATLGANATVLCGVTVGEFAVVGAGAVVTRDVPARAIVIGSPAKRVGTAGEDGRPAKKRPGVKGKA